MALASARGAEHFVSLGDVVGRGDPNGCVAWVRDHATIALAGNRDLDHLDWLRPELQEVVRTWGRQAKASNFVLTHGDPRCHPVLHSGAIRDGFRRVRPLLIGDGVDLWFFGHTHWARIWRLDEEGPVQLEGATLSLAARTSFAVNVGTTGLPRAGCGGASITTYDDTTRWLEIVPL